MKHLKLFTDFLQLLLSDFLARSNACILAAIQSTKNTASNRASRVIYEGTRLSLCTIKQHDHKLFSWSLNLKTSSTVWQLHWCFLMDLAGCWTLFLLLLLLLAKPSSYCLSWFSFVHPLANICIWSCQHSSELCGLLFSRVQWSNQVYLNRQSTTPLQSDN